MTGYDCRRMGGSLEGPSREGLAAIVESRRLLARGLDDTATGVVSH